MRSQSNGSTHIVRFCMTYTKQRYRRDIKRVTMDTIFFTGNSFCRECCQAIKLYSFNRGGQLIDDSPIHSDTHLPFTRRAIVVTDSSVAAPISTIDSRQALHK